MARSPRYWAALGIVLAWAAALGWLALRRVTRSDTALITSQASLRLAPGEAWYRVMAGDVQIGYSGITLDTLANGRYRIREQLSLELPGDTALIRTIRSTEYFLGPGLGVDSLVSRFVRPGRRAEFRAADVGAGWDVRTESEGNTQMGRLELPERAQPIPMAPVPIRVVPLRLALVGALATGNERTLPVAVGWPSAAWSTSLTTTEGEVAIYADSSEVDPATRQWQPVTWDTTPTRTLTVDTPEGAVRLRLDLRGNVVSVEHPFGVRWIREDFNVARFNFRNVLDQLETGIRAQMPVMRRARPAELVGVPDQEPAIYLATRRDGSRVDPMLLMSSSTGRQRFTRGHLIVSRTGSTLGRVSRSIPSDPLVQLQDSTVIAFAESIEATTSSPGFVQLAAAIRNRVTLDTTAGAATDAVSALRRGAAAPEGVARLMVAVLRRHNIGARLAIGVRPTDQGLLTAAWVEAVQGNSNEWSAIDPTSGRPMHTAWIRLSHAGTAEPEDLMPLVADVRFTLVDSLTNEGAAP